MFKKADLVDDEYEDSAYENRFYKETDQKFEILRLDFKKLNLVLIENQQK